MAQATETQHSAEHLGIKDETLGIVMEEEPTDDKHQDHLWTEAKLADEESLGTITQELRRARVVTQPNILNVTQRRCDDEEFNKAEERFARVRDGRGHIRYNQ